MRAMVLALLLCGLMMLPLAALAESPSIPAESKLIPMEELEFQLLQEFPAQASESGGDVGIMATGSWSSQTGGPTLYNTGILYGGGVFSPPSNVPPGVVTGNIYWGWSVINYRPDLRVGLCNVTRDLCIEVSHLGSGGTSVFAGLPATDSYQLVFIINGNGSAIYPYVYGQQNYFILNWEN
ncbi:flagellar protein FlhE [Desulfurispirillum indicum]|uniref:flagellar protein FlhE n=1 Tax=Desulfurispirillum indicum TaxID=936456 RepID=UPI001CFAA46D|nr:flagellar protein FlhE [Desulfurispirillum indicum]UCZ57671.1 flagellar protein FlhE [Desulfurispirillum indicum]